MNPVGRYSWHWTFARFAPAPVLNGFRQVRGAWHSWCRRTVITKPSGRIVPNPDRTCALLVVGRSFDQRKPDAMMTCRMGYANAFEALGIPYVVCDWRSLPGFVGQFPRAFALVFGADVPEMTAVARKALSRIPHATWVNPWFGGERQFFAVHGLPAETWVWPAAHRQAILEMYPRFVFTATVPSGLGFFEGWSASGLPVRSLPLACDTTLYAPDAPGAPEFEGIELAFVGGYWESKGRALDRYLRPFEDRLVVYGYNRWPYRGYRGRLPRACEPALYRQACVCPVVNEPTVALLKGQINERVFKVLGAGGAPVVDAVPAYRELFSGDELPIPNDEAEFAAQVCAFLSDPDLRRKRAERGRSAVMARHTYVHRVRSVLDGLRLEPSRPEAP